MTIPRSESLVPFRTRLHKFLASAGVDSRRKCEQLMLEGRVTVDGKEVRDLAYMVEPSTQQVKVDGEIVREQPKHYFMINKPNGYVCTHYDPEGRPKAIDLVPIHGLALFTIGRLDEDSEGLLLVTNDGQMAEKLAHPRFKVERVYRVQVAGHPSAEVLDQLKQGFFFEEGKFRVQRAKALKTQGRSTWLEIILTEGRNREIRRLLARVGHKVMGLQRIAFGPIRLGSLPVGEYRVLTARELVGLRASVAGKRRPNGTRLPPRPAAAAGEGKTGDAAATGERPAVKGASRSSDRRPPRPGARVEGRGGVSRGAGRPGTGEGRSERSERAGGPAGGGAGAGGVRRGGRPQETSGPRTGGRPQEGGRGGASRPSGPPRGRKPPRGPRPPKP